MARGTGEGPNQEYLEDILSAADAWRERCLMEDGSVFPDDEELWTRENVQELRKACQPPTHGRTDMSWSFLKQQLQDKRPEILRLAAEAVWLTDLYPTTPAGRGTVLEAQPLRGTLGVIKSAATGEQTSQ